MAKKSLEPKSPAELLEKLRAFCAYQERSRVQVLRKMYGLGIEEDAREGYIKSLENEGFLNEVRFVKQFVRSRAVVKGWGPRKIAMALQREAGNGRDFILEGEELGKAIQKLSRDASKKAEGLKAKADPKIREKLLAFCLSRGFEFDTCKKIVRDILAEKGIGNQDLE